MKKKGKNNKTSLRPLWEALKEIKKDTTTEVVVVIRKKGTVTLLGAKNAKVLNEEAIRESLFRVVTRN